MAKGKSTKKKSAAYRLYNEETGTHYVIRLGREGFDKLKDKQVKRFDYKLKTHAKFKLKKIK
ncbi:MAG: hypothetical protein JNK26_03385 [Candidatus Doudnabacteria bacterium]|nr:hypothetical protein [Candidatus Doudnabacteria bacterium]